MRYRRLGKTGMKVSEVSLGTWQLGGGWGRPYDEKLADETLAKALEMGINFLDTADVYSDQLSERTVGKWVRKYRDRLYLATKVGRRFDPHVAESYTPDGIERFVDEALVNTGLGELDLVQLHCPPTPVYENDAIFMRMEKIRQKGKVKHFGVSVEKVEEALRASDYPVVESVQIIFNMFRLKPASDCFSTLKSKDIGIIVRVPLASGLLSGKLKPGTTFVPGDHRHFNRNGEMFDKGETFSGVSLDQGYAAVEALRKNFGDRPLFEYALRWILMFEEVSTVIPGASKVSQVGSNVQSAELPELSATQMAAVRQIYDQFIREEVHHLW